MPCHVIVQHCNTAIHVEVMKHGSFQPKQESLQLIRQVYHFHILASSSHQMPPGPTGPTGDLMVHEELHDAVSWASNDPWEFKGNL